MKIRKILIENFLSYAPPTTFEFGDQTTIILGQNNTGKSKLFDAINWVLFDQIYHSEKEDWLQTSEFGIGLFNRRSLTESADSRVTARVSLFMGDDNRRYVASRESSVTRTDNNWEMDSTQTVFKLSRTEQDSGRAEILIGQDARDEMAQILPRDLQRYYLFQGESVSQIMHLSDKAAFGKALNELARLDVFEKAVRHADLVVKRLRSKREAKIKLSNERHAKLKALQESSKEFEDEIEGLEAHKAGIISNREGAEEQLETETSWLTTYESYRAAEARVNDRRDQLKALREHREALRNVSWKETLFNRWVFAVAASQLREFSVLFGKLARAGVVPELVRQEWLIEMLKNHVCLVCERPVEAESQAEAAIRQKVHAREFDRVADEMTGMARTIESFALSLTNVGQEITDDNEQVAEIDSRIERVSNLHRNAEKDRDALTVHGVANDIADEFDRRQKSAQALRRQIQDLKDQENFANGQLEQARQNLREVEIQRDELVASGSSQSEQRELDLAQQVSVAAHKLQQDFRATTIRSIEKRARGFFDEMVRQNAAKAGSLVLDDKLREVYTVDSDHNRIENINQANRVSIQLAFIAAVLSEAALNLGAAFPFVADAPISALGGDNKLAAIEAMSHAFDQAVIILKDDIRTDDLNRGVRDPVREFINKSDKVTKAYVLTMDGAHEGTQITVAQCIKG